MSLETQRLLPGFSTRTHWHIHFFSNYDANPCVSSTFFDILWYNLLLHQWNCIFSCVCDDKQCLHLNFSLWLLHESLWMLPSHVTFDSVLLTCCIPGFCIHMTTARCYCVKLLFGNWRGTLTSYYMMPVSNDIFVSIYQCEFKSLIAFVDLHELMLVPSDIVTSIYLWIIYTALRFVYVHHACTQWHCCVNLSYDNCVILLHQIVVGKLTWKFDLHLLHDACITWYLRVNVSKWTYVAHRLCWSTWIDACTKWHYCVN